MNIAIPTTLLQLKNSRTLVMGKTEFGVLNQTLLYLVNDISDKIYLLSLLKDMSPDFKAAEYFVVGQWGRRKGLRFRNSVFEGGLKSCEQWFGIMTREKTGKGYRIAQIFQSVSMIDCVSMAMKELPFPYEGTVKMVEKTPADDLLINRVEKDAETIDKAILDDSKILPQRKPRTIILDFSLRDKDKK